MTNVSIPDVNMLKNISTLGISVPIIFSIKLGFISVNGPREIYFVDVLRSSDIRESSIFITSNPGRYLKFTFV